MNILSIHVYQKTITGSAPDPSEMEISIWAMVRQKNEGFPLGYLEIIHFFLWGFSILQPKTWFFHGFYVDFPF
jgi:hypothetical protein